MLTRNVKKFTHLGRAKCPSVGNNQGILYLCPIKKAWFLLHNNKDMGGGSPGDFKEVKEEYGFKFSWHLCNESDKADSAYDVELLEPEPESTTSIKVMQRVHMGLRFRGTLSLESVDGVAHYCPDHCKWYLLSNSSSFCGDSPYMWDKVQKEYDVKYSWKFADKDGVVQFEHLNSMEPLGSTAVKKKEKIKYITIDYSILEEGAEVLFAVDGDSPEMNLPTRGKLHQDGDWYILHNDRYKIGSRPGVSIKTLFDGEFEHSWTICKASNPYSNLIRFDILSRPTKKVLVGHKHVTDKFAVGQTITALSSEDYYKKFNRKQFDHGGQFEMFTGHKAIVRQNNSTSIEVSWVDSSEHWYTMNKNEFQEYYDLESIVIHGTPGTGKTHTRDAVDAMIEVMGGDGRIRRVSASAHKIPIQTYTIEGHYKNPISEFGYAFDLLSKSEHLKIVHPDGKCKVIPTSDWEVQGDQVPRTSRIDTLLILGL